LYITKPEGRGAVSVASIIPTVLTNGVLLHAHGEAAGGDLVDGDEEKDGIRTGTTLPHCCLILRVQSKGPEIIAK
jgi:hypothetical protein